MNTVRISEHAAQRRPAISGVIQAPSSSMERPSSASWSLNTPSANDCATAPHKCRYQSKTRPRLRPSRHDPLESRIAALRDGVGVAEGAEERLLPLAQHFPGLAVCRRCGVIRAGGDEQRELPCARLVAVIWKRGVISGDGLRRELR